MSEQLPESATVAVEPVVGPDHVGDANKMVSDPTYEVRVAGPDDVIPMPDELSALRHANAINRAYLADRLKNPDNEVMCVAAVHAVMPPTTDEDHKKNGIADC